MNDSELEKKLMAARIPARDEYYWEAFPRGVLAKLRAAPARRPVEHHWLPRLAWGGGIAFACLVIGFAIGHWNNRAKKSAPYALLQNERLLREVLTLFPNRVRAIVQDERGLQLVLSDQPDVPTSTPLWVKICDGKQCASLVTFSGQEIDVAGQKITVSGRCARWDHSGRPPIRVVQHGAKLGAKRLKNRSQEAECHKSVTGFYEKTFGNVGDGNPCSTFVRAVEHGGPAGADCGNQRSICGIGHLDGPTIRQFKHPSAGAKRN